MQNRQRIGHRQLAEFAFRSLGVQEVAVPDRPGESAVCSAATS